jgi:hypothetical protein
MGSKADEDKLAGSARIGINRPAGTPADSEGTLPSAELSSARPVIEAYLLEQPAEAYARMMRATLESVAVSA